MWRACNLTAFTPCLTGPVDYPFASHHEEPGFNPQGLCENGILLLVLSLYIGDPDVIDHCGLVWAGLRPEPSLDNVIIPLDLTQLFCPGFTFAAGPPSGFTTTAVESLQSHRIHTQSHWSSGSTLCFPLWGTWVQSPEGYLCKTGIILLALSRYNTTITNIVFGQQCILYSKFFVYCLTTNFYYIPSTVGALSISCFFFKYVFFSCQNI
jgi:hypothetical protein